MLRIDANLNTVIDRVTLFLEPQEAAELIEKMSYLLNDRAYHHDHMEDGSAILDLAILDRQNLESYSKDLRPLLIDYLGRKDVSNGT